MRFKASLRAPTLDVSRFKGALRSLLAETIAQGAFEWLNATTVKIPVWSGASLATFFPLASRIGFALSMAPTPGAPNRISLGIGQSQGTIEAEGEDGRVSFKYATTLPHLIYNESNDANSNPDPTLFGTLLNPGPYEFQEAGRQAFEAFASGVRLPDPTRFIVLRRIRVR